MSKDIQISSYVLDMMIFHAQKDYPHEACGIVLGPKGIDKAIGVFPIPNIQDKLHAKDPKRYPRQATTAYFMDPRQVQIVEHEAKDKDFEIKIYFHSHPDHGVYFSEEDKAMACPWGEPLDPKVSYLVIGVSQGKADGASLYYWNEAKQDFSERKLKLNAETA